MANFLKNENKNIDALKYYLCCLYFELNYYKLQEQIKDYTSINLSHEDKEYLLRILNNRHLNVISKDLITQIKKLKEYFTQKTIEKVYIYCEILKYRFISNESFQKFINDVFDNSRVNEDEYIDEIIEQATKIINSY